MKKFVIAAFVILSLAIPSIAAEIRLMTYNIRLDLAADKENSWGNRTRFFLAQLKFHEPDIFGVQEALPNQIKDIATGLPEYSHVGIGRDGEDRGEASAIFFKSSRFQVSESGTFWLSETPDQISKGWDAALNRICTYGLFRDRRTGKRFWVFNTHFDHVGAIARQKSVELILSRIEVLNRKRFPVVLMGDLNAEPDSEPITILKKSMTDTRSVSIEPPFGPSGTFNGFRHEQPVKRLIDYIFINDPKRFAIKKYAVLSDSDELRYPSDHLPILIVAELTGK